MTPTFIGRFQTRLFVTFTLGLVWTVVITPFLPVTTPDGYQLAVAIDDGLDDVYKLTLAALAITGIFGALVWEPIYHLLMQFRWEKDWPAIFNLGQMIPEGITTFLLLHVAVLNPLGDLEGGDKEQFVPVVAYVMLFVTTWIVTWLFANGPMKIFFIRWRFRGGRLV